MRIKYGIKIKGRETKKEEEEIKKSEDTSRIRKNGPQDLLDELLENNVAKILSAANMSEFIGEHNNLNYLLEKNAELQPDPSMSQVRNMVVEYVGLPLGCQ